MARSYENRLAASPLEGFQRARRQDPPGDSVLKRDLCLQQAIDSRLEC
jgi:hypothetical protein